MAAFSLGWGSLSTFVRIPCGYPLMHPFLLLQAKGIHHLVNDTIGKCDIDVRR